MKVNAQTAGFAKICWIFVVTIALLLGGCTSMVYSALASSNPRFPDVSQQWPELKTDEGRIVFFFSKLSLAETFSPIGVGGAVFAKIEIDRGNKVELMDRLFVFFDLPIGHYRIKGQRGTVFDPHYLDVDLKKGETTYVAIGSHAEMLTVDKRIAETELSESTHHIASVALPYNVIEKIGEKAGWNRLGDLRDQTKSLTNHEVRRLLTKEKNKYL